VEAKAHLRYVRITPRKARLVLGLIRGKEVGEAISILRHTPRAASPIIEKLLNSAIANAEHNYNMNPEKLVISQAYANEGPTMKRIQPRAHGRAFPILKRTSHITLVVKEKEETEETKPAKTKRAKSETRKPEAAAAGPAKAEPAKTEPAEAQAPANAETAAGAEPAANTEATASAESSANAESAKDETAK